jgi:hypothetical protein
MDDQERAVIPGSEDGQHSWQAEPASGPQTVVPPPGADAHQETDGPTPGRPETERSGATEAPQRETRIQAPPAPDDTSLHLTGEQEPPPVPGPGKHAENPQPADGGLPEPQAPPTAADGGQDNGDSGISVTQNFDSVQGTAIGVLQQIVRRMVDSHELKPHEVAAYTAKFAPPPNIGEAIEKLGKNRVVVLAGPRGCGRRMSAVWLLSQKKGLTMHEVERELNESFLPSDLAAEKHVCWLLDLRDDDASVQLNFGNTLAARREDLKDQSSYLAVIIREDLWRKVGAGGDELLVQLTPARASDIILQYLTKHEPPISEDDAKTWLQYQDINKSIENLTPPDAVLWAESIHAEHFTPPKPSTDTPLKDVISGKAENVLSARRAWRTQLLKWHSEHPGGRERAFLLAAAALENMPVEQVFTGSARLSAALGNEENHAPRGLTGPGIIELVDSVGADLSAAETVRFRRPGYADSILEYFWTDRMHLRTEFVSWLSTEEALNKGDQEAEAAAERIGQYVLLWSIRRNSFDLVDYSKVALKKYRPVAA